MVASSSFTDVPLFSPSLFVFFILSAVTATSSASVKTLKSMDQFTILNNKQGAFEAQQILEEQRRQQALLLLQPQQLLDKTLAPINDLGGPRGPHFTNSAAVYRSSPLDIECRNIIALQEELKRQEIKRKAEEIINQKVHEQALLLELQKQAAVQQQQNTTNHLLGRFAELDQLVTKQDLLARLTQEQQQRSALNLEHLHAVGLHGHGPSGIDSLGVTGSNHAINQNIIDALRSQRNFDSAPMHGLRQRLRSPLSDPNAILSSTSELSQVLNNNVSSFRESHSNLAGAIPKNIHTLQSLQSLSMMQQQNNDFMGPSTQQGGSSGGALLSQHNNYLPSSAHSNDGLQYGNVGKSKITPGLPEIRYFNNGAEVSRDGRAFQTSNGDINVSKASVTKRRITEEEIISLDDDDDEPTQKAYKKPKIESIETKEDVRSSIRTNFKPKNEIDVKVKTEVPSPPSGSMMSRCNLPKKNARKLSEFSSSVSRRLNMPEVPVKSEQKTKKQSTSQEEREEERVDAANVLLGLMKRN